MVASSRGSTRTLTFVHRFGSREASDVGQAIALTPEAANTQHQAGITPLTCNDFVDRRRLLVEVQVDLIRWELAWLGRLADGAGLPHDVIHALFAFLKTPMDSVIAWSRLFKATIEQVAPDEVVYIGFAVPDEVDPWHGSHMYFSPLLGDRPIADRLLPAVCAELELPFRREVEPAPALVPPASPSAATGMIARVRDRLVLPYNFWPTGTWRRGRDTSLLLWPGGYGARQVAAAEHAMGRTVAVIDRDTLAPRLLQALPGGWRHLSETVDTKIPDPTPLTDVSRAALVEIDEWTGVPGAADALGSRLSTYVDRLCPAVERVASVMSESFHRSRVTKVIAANPYTVVEFGGLLAATRLGLERLLVQHGDHAFPYDFWLAEQTQNFDTLATSDPTVPPDMHDAAERLGCHAPAFQSWAPRVDQNLKRRSLRRANVADVCYLPTLYLGDSVEIAGSDLEDSWYFRWQCTLLDTMAGYPDLTFLWKALGPGSQRATDPFEQLVEDIPNVRFATTPFRAVARRIGCLVTDVASTGFYEAHALGIPSLAVSFTDFEDIRPRAQAMFGTAIVPCADVEQATLAIGDFIDVRFGRRIDPGTRSDSAPRV